MNEFVYDVLDNSARKLRQLKATGIYNSSNVVIVSDEHEVSYLLCGTIELLKQKAAVTEVHLIVNGTPARCDFVSDLEELRPEENRFFIWKSPKEYFAYAESRAEKYPEIFIDIVNFRLPVYVTGTVAARRTAYKNKELQIKEVLEYVRKHPENKFHLLTCIPDITAPLPEVTHAIAEREYEVIFRNAGTDSPEQYVINLENVIREYEDMMDRVQVIRLDRTFGPGILQDDAAGVISVLKNIQDEQSLTIYDKDRLDFYSACYARDAVVGILLAIQSGRKGNIYHVSTWEISRFQIISNLYGALPEHKISLKTEECKAEETPVVTYRMLNARKLRLVRMANLSKHLYTTKLAALKNTAHWFLGEVNYIPKNDINLYYGRMERIRELELDILREVDKICKENQIPYFLAAGTMLGAIRHNGFIPWDDDVDIGMLPDDYERFLKICPESLSIEYGYQSVSTESTSHYIHDKIRLKNSFFSTNYSNRYQMLNGVYIDVFVYYKTSNRPFFQKSHIKQIIFWRKAVAICWAVRTKKTWKYRLAFKISRKIPVRWVDKIYRRVLMKYNKRNTKYRVDGGFNLKKVGAFPDEWFHGIINHEFCGIEFPILKHYDEYLTHWFGEHYMDLLPLSGRRSVHDVVRIDLGQNLFDETRYDPRFRDVDIRGELYERNKSEECNEQRK